MGRNGRRMKSASGEKRKNRDGEGSWNADTRNPENLTNEGFVQYYRGEIVPEAEWETFINCCRTALPTAMRINATMNEELTEKIKAVVKESLAGTNPGESNIGDLAFVPRGLGVQATLSRGELKRDASHKTSKQLIASLNDLGYLTRQEAVSMIPPLLLDAQPGHKVLDMCAAPGSKTGQILEAVMGPNGATKSHPEGVVVANDVNAGRMDVLACNTGRMPGAHAHLIVTQHDAMQYPLATKAEDKFDRVLCDVMCSGDGTLRKSMDMWPRWNCNLGPELHISQLRVLTRGMQLCKKGGVVVYSTCSLNPFEDEAVVSACVSASKGTFRIADTSLLLPNLKRTPGKTDWRFLTKSLQNEYKNFEEAKAAHGDKDNKDKFPLKESMFASADLPTQGIEHTMRVFPHQQDTGGFFIAKLECLEDFPGSISAPKANIREQELKPISKELQATVIEAMGLDADFPAENLYVRSESCREQKFYYCCPGVKTTMSSLHAKVVHSGSKVIEAFAKFSNEKLRFTDEGIYNLAPLLSPRFFLDIDASYILGAFQNVKGTTVTLQNFIAAGPLVNGKKVTSRADFPKKCFIIRCNMPDGFGEMLIPAEVSDTVNFKIRERQLMLLKYSLGIPLVEEKEEEEGVAAAAPVEADVEEKKDDVVEGDKAE